MKNSSRITFKNFFSYEKSFFKKKKKISEKYNNIIKTINDNLDTSKNTFHVLSKKFKLNFNLKELKKFKKFKSIAIIGMGGSILGSEAIFSFLKYKINKEIFFFNNLDDENLFSIKKKNLNSILFIIISKSGTTIETLTNVFLLKILKQNSRNIIIISEKKNNFLYKTSKKMNLYFIEHKHYIGGRYSVLSEVGLVPAFMMGINIIKLRENIINALKKKNTIFLKNSSIYISYLLQNKKFKNMIFLNYAPQLENFLFWLQQMVAESLGKDGKGFLPVVSPAPKDHHSLLQLYLDGPKDKFFYIFSVEKNKNLKVQSRIEDPKLNFLKNKNLNKIKSSQKDAFIKAIKSKKIPFREFKIHHINEQTLGKLFSYFMLETAIIGKLGNINPFNQPAVEEVKINTKRNLS